MDHMIALAMDDKRFQVETLDVFWKFRVSAVEGTGWMEEMLHLTINM